MTSYDFNKKALEILFKMIENDKSLNVSIVKLENGATIVDCGVTSKGSFEAGKMIIEISLGGYAKAQIVDEQYNHLHFKSVLLEVKDPGPATLCSQGAFPLFPDQKSPFYISGPGRVLFREPKNIFDSFNCFESPEEVVFIIEDDEYPSQKFINKLAEKSGKNPKDFYFVVVPIPSICGNTEVAGKIVEDVMFNLFLTFNWDVRKISIAKAKSPIMPFYTKKENILNLTPDDFIFYGGSVDLYVDGVDDSLRKIIPRIIFENTDGFGKTFFEMINEANGNIRKIKGYPLIFSPAKITVWDTKNKIKETWGELHLDILLRKLSNIRY
ncbi:MAG: methenyltetrahydromethanopterin cyclohydrolase [Candidatus Asgardarchaeia archaeon]